MVREFSKLTGLTDVFAEMCLRESGWKFETAVGNFGVTKVRERLKILYDFLLMHCCYSGEVLYLMRLGCQGSRDRGGRVECEFRMHQPCGFLQDANRLQSNRDAAFNGRGSPFLDHWEVSRRVRWSIQVSVCIL